MTPTSFAQRRRASTDITINTANDTTQNLGDTLLYNNNSSQDSLAALPARRPLLDDVMSGSGKDSMVYDIKAGKLYIYKEGTVDYQDTKMDADYFELKLNDDLILAKGAYGPDSTTVETKAVFTEGDQTYDLDSLVYNVKSEKAKIYGIAFEESDGVLRGDNIKRVNPEIFNISGGKYSTCDAEKPHFYLALTKAQFVETKKSKKVIVGPSYLVIEDVPLPLFVPFGFFPMMKDTNSGVILPEFGEDALKGFFLRGLGYYTVFNDYVDLAVRGGFYTFGSWEASATSSYKVRYKYSGNLNFNYSRDIFGMKGSSDYSNMSNYSIAWTHSQDSKFRPGSNFAASVNFSSSSYNKFDATDMSDYVSSQTNSSVSYSKTWAGTPFSFSTNLQHSQSMRDSTVMLSLPNMTFSVSRFMPFQRKTAMGKQKWYEKIGVSYTGTLNNSVTTKENELFSEQMFKDMKYGVKHSVPVSTSFNLLKYLSISPSANYTERWYFNKVNKQWNPEEEVIVQDTTMGFYRVYDYSFSASASTRIYGTFNFKGKDPILKALRHVITPSISGSYKPDFGDPKFGYYKQVQSNVTGDVTTYSPYQNGIYGVPSSGKSAAISFSLGNTLEAKVRSRRDSTGYRKLSLIEGLQISSSYNFLADSLNLSPFNVSFRTTLYNSVGINVNSTFDPYAIDENGHKINTFMVKQGKLARLTSLGFSFGYSFRSIFGAEGGTGSSTIPQATQEEQRLFDDNQVDYAEQQRILAQRYYDFSVPWNFSFNYNFSYSKPAWEPNITQTLSFNASANITSKMGITFSSGYDFEERTLTTGSFSFTRDLHCWQIGFSWVPIGFRKSWNFTIQAKSSLLSDLKYEKNSSYTNYMSSYY